LLYSFVYYWHNSSEKTAGKVKKHQKKQRPHPT
jgi:hypothetical protein